MIDWRTSRLFLLLLGLLVVVLGIAGVVELQKRGVTLATVQDTLDIGAFIGTDATPSPDPEEDGEVAGSQSTAAPELPHFPTVTITVPERNVFAPPEPTPAPDEDLLSTLAETLTGS